MTDLRPDRETVVFLHSLGTDSRLWRSQAAALANSYDVLTPDAPGHGGSAWIPGLTVQGWVEDIGRHITDITARPVHLVGLSMGGVQAVATAARHPELVRSLTIANSFAALDSTTAEQRIDSIRTSIAERGMSGYADHYLDVTLTRATTAETRRDLHSAIAGMSPQAYIDSAETTFRADNTGLLAAVSCPTQVIAGELDEKTPLPLAEALQAGMPSAELHVIPGAGHLSNIDAPHAFTHALTAFLARTGADARAETA